MASGLINEFQMAKMIMVSFVPDFRYSLILNGGDEVIFGASGKSFVNS